MTGGPVRVSPAWLELRERADSAARATDLVEQVRRHLPAGGPTVIHDLGCGTGSMGRWLAPRLPGAQHWILYDRDVDLLARSAGRGPARAADAAPVTIETRQRDITRMNSGELGGACLITASALLDLLTAAELARVVEACTDAGCPVLMTLSVVGRVDLIPADPLDAPIRGAFNDHQRRPTGGRRLLGPDAVTVAAEAFTRLGADVLVRPSPWRLGDAESTLITEWLSGWVGAAVEQRPELATAAPAYARRRRAQTTSGRLSVTVHHEDLLVRPR